MYIYFFSYLGLSLYFNLARHAFGDVQKILFPKYFSLNSLLSAITLIQFGKMHVAANAWDAHTYLQVRTHGLYLFLRVHNAICKRLQPFFKITPFDPYPPPLITAQVNHSVRWVRLPLFPGLQRFPRLRIMHFWNSYTVSNVNH